MRYFKLYQSLVAGALVIVSWLATEPARANELATKLRRPVALQLSADGKWLYVANQRSGSISVVDLDEQKVKSEYAIGKSLSDLVALPQKNRLLATDEDLHQLLIVDVQGKLVRVNQRLPVNPYPVSVVAGSDGRQAWVASLWSRRLTIVDLPKENEPAHAIGQMDLPFAPRRLLFTIDDTRLIVGDSFGGKLGVVDTRIRKLLHVREIPGHNIRGLGVSADGSMLAVSHQMLNELAHTVRNDVHWGLLMSNDLRWLRLQSVLDADSDLYKGAHMHPLGEASRATGDPAGLAFAPDGTVVVALGGVNEVAVGKETDFSLFRTKVGKRPTAVAVSADSKRAYVANTFDDTVSIVDLVSKEETGTMSLGPQPDLTSAEKGELLFYDAGLSHDSWMSCNSCHTDGHTNGMLNDNFSDASFGAPKRVLSLLGRAGTEPLAWTGNAEDFDTQIRKSISNTMQSDEDPKDWQVEALTAYVQTLASPPPIDLARDQRDHEAVKRGEVLFQNQGCAKCHQPPTYTSPGVYNVGLEDTQGNDRFNPPTLRGVGQRGPYFHDGRAKSLEDVFREYRHKLGRDLTEVELNDLLAFLRSL